MSPFFKPFARFFRALLGCWIMIVIVAFFGMLTTVALALIFNIGFELFNYILS